MPSPLSFEDIANMAKTLHRATGAAYFFDAPLVYAADADDPLFERFKTIIGPHHWTPREALAHARPEAAARGVAARSVIVWVLPVRREIRESNRAMTDRPSEMWAAMRSFGELPNTQMKRQFERVLEAKGWTAASPHETQMREGLDVIECAGRGSFWSERHAAFAAGAGTFGLSGGLITERGVAMRLGSVVTDLPLPATPRPYGDDPFAWCTRCGACARRCPSGSVGATPEARDKMKCAGHIQNVVSPGREDRYGWMDLGLGCGLCQTAVPCEDRRP